MPRRAATALAVLAITLLCSAISFAGVTQDGNWWKQLARPDKLRVVEAEIDGISNGWWLGFTTYDEKVQVAIIDEMNSKQGRESDKLRFMNEVATASEKQKSSPPKFTRPFKYYIDGIDDFYAKHPDANTVEVGAVMQCLSDKPWKTCDETAKLFSNPK